MSFFDEPQDKSGSNQIVDSATDEGNRSKAWLTTKDSTSTRQPSVFTITADAVVWLAGAGLFARLVLLTNAALSYGLIPQYPAFFALLLAAVVLTYAVSKLQPNDRFYRLTLFTFGILLAVL
jgi:hypothetical protein